MPRLHQRNMLLVARNKLLVARNMLLEHVAGKLVAAQKVALV